MITISLDEKRLKALGENIRDGVDAIEVAYMRALDGAAYETRRMIVDELSNKINASIEKISSAVVVNPSSESSPLASVEVRDVKIAPKHLQARQQANGVSYKPYRTGGSEFVQSGFGPNIPRLGRHVFKRQTRERNSLQRVKGVSIQDEANKLGLEVKAKEHFYNIYRQRLRFYMARTILFSTSLEEE